MILMVVLIFSPIIYKMIFDFPNSDYPSHIYWAEQMFHPSDSDNVPLDVWAHASWHFLVIIFSFISLGSFPIAGFLATLFSIVLMALILYYLIRPILLEKGVSLWWGVIVAIGLNLVAPLYIYIIKDKQFYFGYLGLNVYHNPTNILLKPFALLVFIWALRCFQTTRSSWRHIFIAALFSILATFTKPNFAICFLPSLGLLILWYVLRRKTLDWKMIIFGFMLPTLTVLVWQFWLTYATSEGTSIQFAPFGVMNIRSGWLEKKFILSIIFPALVTVMYLKDALKDTRIWLAWLTLALGSFYTYFLAESGWTFSHGNFTWSSLIAMLILFCISTIFFIERIKENRMKTIVLGLVWGLHLLSGIGYYLHIMFKNTYV